MSDSSTGNLIKNIFGTTTGSQNTVITKIFTDETFLQYNSIKINLELRPKINGSYADSNSYAVSSEYIISKIEDINTVIKSYSF
jgi:K+-transporting ATPase c subunit